MTLKIGDKVKIIAVHPTDWTKATPFLIEYFHSTARVSKITEGGMIYLDTTGHYAWNPTWLEKVIDISNKHSHYYKDISNYKHLDVYRLCEIYNITDPCMQHVLKKILVVGGRGSKDALRDVQDVIDTCERWKEMRQEELDCAEKVT